MNQKNPKSQHTKKNDFDGQTVKLEVVRDISPNVPKNRYGEPIMSSTRYYADGTKRADRFTSMLYATLADLDGASNIATQVAAIGHMVDQLVLAHSILLQLHANLSRQAQAILLANGDDGEGAKQVQRMKGLCRAMLAVQFLRLSKNQLPADGDSPATDFLALTGRSVDGKGLDSLLALVGGAGVKGEARQMFDDLSAVLEAVQTSSRSKIILVDANDPASIQGAINRLKKAKSRQNKKKKEGK